MKIISDLHGDFKTYETLISDCEESIQIGDMGYGYAKDYRKWPAIFQDPNTKHKWFRGNHDNPERCNNSSNFLGDFGFRPDKNLFWVGGANTPPPFQQEIGIAWWPDEWLSKDQEDACRDLYLEHKPKIVLSHTCPRSVVDHMPLLDNTVIYEQRGEHFLQSLFEIHQPQLWIFGHFHQDKIVLKYNTTFVCIRDKGFITI